MEPIKTLLDACRGIPAERYEHFLSFLGSMPEDTVKQILHAEVEKGHYVLKAGSSCDTVYFLLRGSVSGEAYTSRGRSYSFMDFSNMWVLGDFELFADCAEYSVSIRADEDCTVLKMPKDAYKNWIRQDAAALYMRTCSILSVLTFERRIDREYLQKSSKERLAMFLVRLYETDSREKNGSYTVRCTQSELADKIGANLRSVQRSIAALEQEELVVLKKGKMTLSCEQYEKLKQYADE